MSNNIAGRIEKAFKNDKGYGSILVNGTWYGTGKETLASLEGQEVSFLATGKEVNGKTYFNVSGKVATSGPAAAAAPAAGPRKGGRSYNDEKQVLIMRQSTLSTAAAVVSAALAAGALTLPKAKGAAFDAVLGFVDTAAEHLYNNVVADTGFEVEEEDPSLPPASDFNPTEA